jgi:hypothetical protein
MGLYCEEHIKEGITQNRVFRNSLDVKRIDYHSECDLCRKPAIYWIG